MFKILFALLIFTLGVTVGQYSVPSASDIMNLKRNIDDLKENYDLLQAESNELRMRVDLCREPLRYASFR